jgi:hypothetical protein
MGGLAGKSKIKTQEQDCCNLKSMEEALAIRIVCEKQGR